ncbi:recombinase RarA [Helicobacter sp. 16-1353]|uniref:replication-associated recombination protein A n=1 Tax=Helicobacter sp. 16-1353 TaxID=2004996 RepID=UPI000DCCA34F|nr:replication-associated recombination protein A [Helicobacter sp. 16-1353]RAX52741.1 recombinase RarA [Helicobacter sp. 16-1353]
MFAIDFRPKNLSEFVGQKHLVGENAPIANMIKNNSLIHMFFYGPPGSGKTTLARIIAKELALDFMEFNATSFKAESLRKVVSQDSLIKPIIFIDEIHRLNKAQQEILLPIMENFWAIILGASTYNPYSALTNAIRSRSLIFEFKALSSRDLGEILDSIALKNELVLNAESREYIINTSGGDCRAMLNLLDIAKSDLSLNNLKAIRPISMNEGVSEDSTHYDLISALIKSIRGSDENASIYYLARLIKAGENPEFIARRLVILASEDIGNANPNALNIATNTMLAVSKIGYPESRIILSQCVLYLASSPKSNTAYKAIDGALEYIENNKLEIPPHIKNFNKNYKYPHDFGGWVKQQYLPRDLKFVEWSDIGFEKTLQEWLQKIKKTFHK